MIKPNFVITASQNETRFVKYLSSFKLRTGALCSALLNIQNKNEWTYFKNVVMKFLLLGKMAKLYAPFSLIHLHGWSPFCLVWIQKFQCIQISTHFLIWSNPIQLNWRPNVQWSAHLLSVFTGGPLLQLLIGITLFLF